MKVNNMDYEKATERLLDHEGGYVNNPKDPGGETKYGISKRSYPHLNIATLTRDQAKQIYFDDFWNPLGDIHGGLKFQAFDFAVNSGVGTAIRKLQFVVGAADDGVWGPRSAAALSAFETANGISDLLLLYIAERLDFMRKLKNWKDASGGWAARIAANMRFAAKDN